METAIAFRKMHGLGNDFVVIDARRFAKPRAAGLREDGIRLIADRRRGIGCDQVITIEPSTRADAFMRILNADGSEAQACGNATRCVADMLMRELGRHTATIESVAGLLETARIGDEIAVTMDPPSFDWRVIPLEREVSTDDLPLSVGPLRHGQAVNVGNPHAVFFVEAVDAVALEKLGPLIENDRLFPERTNVEIAQVLDAKSIRMRVWERGVGITQACGSAACATLVAAVRRGLAARQASIELDGGALDIEWRAADERIVMTGPVTYVAEGVLDTHFFEGLQGETGPLVLPKAANA